MGFVTLILAVKPQLHNTLAGLSKLKLFVLYLLIKIETHFLSCIKAFLCRV